MVRAAIGNSYRLHTRYLTPGRIEDALKTREIDIGMTYLRLPVEEVTYTKIGNFRMRIFGTSLNLGKKLEDLRFVIPIDGVSMPGVLLRSLDGWPDDQFPRHVQYEFELLESALQVAKTGRAVVYCPDFVVALHNAEVPSSKKLVEIEPPKNFKEKNLSIFLVVRRNEPESRFARSLAKLVRSFS